MKDYPSRLIKSFEKKFFTVALMRQYSTLWLTDQIRCYSLAFTWYNTFPRVNVWLVAWFGIHSVSSCDCSN